MIPALLAWLALAVCWRLAMPTEARGRTWHLVHMLVPGLAIAAWALAPPGLAGPLQAALWGMAAMVGLGGLGWVIGTVRGNHSIMDVVYPLIAFGTALAMVLAAAPGLDLRLGLLMALMAIWALRLIAYVSGTNLATEQEPYASLRRRFGPRWRVWSFFAVYMLQGMIVWVWCLPFAFAAAAGPRDLSALEALGAAVWLLGFAFQAIGDRQLRAFKADPANRGRIMDRGLWARTRHPNYFGETVMWTGYFVFALAHSWGWLTVIGPAYALWFMAWGSATPGNERHMRKTRGAAFDDYARRVPMFFPRLWGR